MFCGVFLIAAVSEGLVAKTTIEKVKLNNWQGLMYSARHVIKRILNPRFLSQMTFYDVASTIHQSLRKSACHLSKRI